MRGGGQVDVDMKGHLNSKIDLTNFKATAKGNLVVGSIFTPLVDGRFLLKVLDVDIIETDLKRLATGKTTELAYIDSNNYYQWSDYQKSNVVIKRKTLSNCKQTDNALKNSTNIILVHGINSGSSTWHKMAPKLASEWYVNGDDYVHLGVEISIKDSNCQQHFKGDTQAIECKALSGISDQDAIRSDISRDYKDSVVGLDKDNFNIDRVVWYAHNTAKSAQSANPAMQNGSIPPSHRVFAINFSNSNQLTYDAQGRTAQSYD